MTTAKPYSLPKLGYKYDALEPKYSSEILELHHKKHHKGYVDGANQTHADLQEARSNNDYAAIRQLSKNQAFNVSGHVMHSLFWRNIAPEGSNKPGKALTQMLKDAFGGTKGLKDQFLAAGTSIQGSGWASLSYEPTRGDLIVEQIFDHQSNTATGAVPILVMDMWEHAFYLQYKNEKKRWAKAFWSMINWDDVGERLSRLEGLDVVGSKS